MNRTNVWLALAAVGCSGLLFALSTGVSPIGWLAWIAPAPVLIFAVQSRSTGLSAAVAFVAYLVGEVSLIYAYHALVPPLVLVISVLIPAIAFAAIAVAARWAALKLPAVAAVFSYPLLLTSWEFLLSLVSPHGTAGALGYSQLDLPWVVQVASLAGVWGISFVTALPPMAFAIATLGRKAWLSAAVPTVVLLLAVALYAHLRLSETEGADAQIALVAVGVAALEQDKVRGREAALSAARDYATAVSSVAGSAERDRPLTVLTPEKAITTFPEWAEEVMSLLAAAAKAANVTLIAGIDEHRADGTRSNVAYAFAPDGAVRASYVKQRLVPGLEREFTPGAQPGLLGREGVAICKDMDFPEVLREYGRADVRLLYVPAWDFVVDAKAHASMAILRGVENGFAVARAAQEGLLTLSDARGRIIASAATSPERTTQVRASVPLGDGDTFYIRHGNLIPWVIVVLSAALLAALPAAAFWRK